MMSTDYDVRYTVEFGYQEPIITINNSVLNKFRDKWDVDDKELLFINGNVMNTLYCSLTKNFNHISTCVSIQEI